MPLQCQNATYKTRRIVKNHLFQHGFLNSYKLWDHHGEKESNDSSRNSTEDLNKEVRDVGMKKMVSEACGFVNTDTKMEGNEGDNYNDQEPNAKAAEFYKLLEDAKQELL
ncbi:hypothetical protein COLO4_06771 [Corchorus olitorius]|uniref:Transposase-associated domain-containing protein n=1 Tax=Corchorus olitorius TaxID=93759 RepID=A0A1R3KM13_9ROSI|nr:hypothetical protein COLO4_06771 [Corchorus olitorius]